MSDKINMVTMSAAAYLRLRKVELDKEFVKRYPNGRFTVNVWDVFCRRGLRQAIAWRNYPRNSPAKNQNGFTVYALGGEIGIGIGGPSFGRSCHFSNIDDACKKALSLGFDKRIIDALGDGMRRSKQGKINFRALVEYNEEMKTNMWKN